MLEGKVVWDGEDNRLGRKRFFEKRELLDDFDRLRRTTKQAQKIVVWVVYSPTNEIVYASEDAGTIRLGDVLGAIEREIPEATLQAMTCIDFNGFCDYAEWRYGHILCWTVA